jgi:hypothetical protein
MSQRLSASPVEPPAGRFPNTPAEWLALVFLLAYGLLLRAWDLGGKPFRVDEAESSINALTILRHGVPVGHYLGLPIYENTLTRPWPESDEYEFKDTSYSDSGLAVYHGRVPLYGLAAAYGLAFAQRLRTVDAVRRSVKALGNPMFGDGLFPDYLVCWQTFDHRFVDPAARTGRNVNYADRVRGAHALVRPDEWVLYRCPARPPAGGMTEP